MNNSIPLLLLLLGLAAIHASSANGEAKSAQTDVKTLNGGEAVENAENSAQLQLDEGSQLAEAKQSRRKKRFVLMTIFGLSITFTYLWSTVITPFLIINFTKNINMFGKIAQCWHRRRVHFRDHNLAGALGRSLLCAPTRADVVQPQFVFQVLRIAIRHMDARTTAYIVREYKQHSLHLQALQDKMSPGQREHANRWKTPTTPRKLKTFLQQFLVLREEEVPSQLEGLERQVEEHSDDELHRMLTRDMAQKGIWELLEEMNLLQVHNGSQNDAALNGNFVSDVLGVELLGTGSGLLASNATHTVLSDQMAHKLPHGIGHIFAKVAEEASAEITRQMGAQKVSADVRSLYVLNQLRRVNCVLFFDALSEEGAEVRKRVMRQMGVKFTEREWHFNLVEKLEDVEVRLWEYIEREMAHKMHAMDHKLTELTDRKEDLKESEHQIEELVNRLEEPEMRAKLAQKRAKVTEQKFKIINKIEALIYARHGDQKALDQMRRRLHGGEKAEAPKVVIEQAGTGRRKRSSMAVEANSHNGEDARLRAAELLESDEQEEEVDLHLVAEESAESARMAQKEADTMHVTLVRKVLDELREWAKQIGQWPHEAQTAATARHRLELVVCQKGNEPSLLGFIAQRLVASEEEKGTLSALVAERCKKVDDLVGRKQQDSTIQPNAMWRRSKRNIFVSWWENMPWKRKSVPLAAVFGDQCQLVRRQIGLDDARLAELGVPGEAHKNWTLNGWVKAQIRDHYLLGASNLEGLLTKFALEEAKSVGTLEPEQHAQQASPNGTRRRKRFALWAMLDTYAVPIARTSFLMQIYKHFNFFKKVRNCIVRSFNYKEFGRCKLPPSVEAEKKFVRKLSETVIQQLTEPAIAEICDLYEGFFAEYIVPLHKQADETKLAGLTEYLHEAGFTHLPHLVAEQLDECWAQKLAKRAANGGHSAKDVQNSIEMFKVKVRQNLHKSVQEDDDGFDLEGLEGLGEKRSRDRYFSKSVLNA